MRAANKRKPAIILSAEDDRGGRESTWRALGEGKIRNEQGQLHGLKTKGSFPGALFHGIATRNQVQDILFTETLFRTGHFYLSG
jgi:hypothetical protein